MAELIQNGNPFLDRGALEKASNYEPSSRQETLPNLPFTGATTPLPMVDGEPTPSALSAWENSVISTSNKKGDGKLTGGGILRTGKEATSDRYPNYIPGDYNNEDAYARGQGWTSKMVNGVGKGLLLTGTTFLQSTVGMFNGVARWIDTGRAASFYDNDFNKQLDELNKKAENYLPNYYTDVEKNARWYSPSKLFTANFFWDGIIKNLGFAAGAAASGAVFTKALSAIPLVSRLFAVGKAAEGLAATEQGLLGAEKAAETYGKIRALSDKFLGSYNAMNPAGRAVVAGLATTGEAGFEAYNNLNQFRDKLLQDYKDTHFGQEATGYELEKINKEADNVGNSSFLLNTALLSATNYIQFPKILGSTYKGEKGIINGLVKETSPIVKTEAGIYAAEQATTRTGRLLSTINKIRPYTFSTSEGFEEGAQYAIQVGTQHYFDKRYNGEVADVLASISQGIKSTLTTDEGMENILIGGLSGSLMLAHGKYREAKEKAKNTAEAVQALNKWQFSDFTKDTIDGVSRGVALQEEREHALKMGDVLESKDKERDYLINYLAPRIKYGRWDLVQADIDQHKQLASTEEGFAQLQAEGKALTTDTRSAYLARIANLESSAENMKSLYQSLNLRFSGLVNKEGERVYSPEVIDKMVYAAMKVADYEKRTPELTMYLTSVGVDVTSVINDLKAGGSEKFNEAAEKIEQSDVIDKDKLLQDLFDLGELSMRRNLFLREYTDIKARPENHKEQPTLAPTTETPKEPFTIKTKSGEKEITPGEEYYLGKVVEHDASGKEVYRAPRLTIIGENEDGTIKIKDSEGKVRDVSKSVFEDYKLGKVSDVEKDKKAKFFMEHWNTVFEFNFGKGKKKRGRLEFSPKEGVLLFTYRDDKGKTRQIEVTADQFVARKGFKEPMIKEVGELTKAQQQSKEQFTTSHDERTAAKKEARLKILSDLFDDLSGKQSAIRELIATKKEQLAKIEEDLGKQEEKIKEAEFTPKKGNLKATYRKALQTAMTLSRAKDQIADEIVALQSQLDDIELTVSYIEDLRQNLDVLPADSKEFLEELNNDLINLHVLEEETAKQIGTLKTLETKIEEALDKAIKYAKSVIDNFTKMYPNVPTDMGQEWVEFLQKNPNFLKLRPYFKSDLRFVEGLIAEVEDIQITPDEDKLAETRQEIDNLVKLLEDTNKELRAKEAILKKFEEVAEKYKKQKELEEKVAKDESLIRKLMGTGDKYEQAVSEAPQEYEIASKKTAENVVTSTKPVKSIKPHHERANTFGINLDKFSNRSKIKGVIVTQKTEHLLGLKGLTQWLKDNSDATAEAKAKVDPSKTIILVMVEEQEDGTLIPVNVEGKAQFDGATPDTAIFQVFPDPKLEWDASYSKSGKPTSMFRQETPKEAVEYYTKEYKDWVEETLKADDIAAYNIEASFGIPDYATVEDDKGNVKRDYNAKTSVTDANLISESMLTTQPLLEVATRETKDKGTTVFKTPLGRVILDLPNAAVMLQNRKLNAQEAETIYKAIYHLATELWENEFDPSSPKASVLINWLKSVVYWGIPKNKSGYGSLYFTMDGNKVLLHVSGKGTTFHFTPQAIKENEAELKTLIGAMYHNINSRLANKDGVWDQPYRQIIDFKEDGTPIYKEVDGKPYWPNYQTYLLSSKGRKPEELPLFTQMKKFTPEQPNRKGVYFTVTDMKDRYAGVPAPATKPTLKATKKEEAKEEKGPVFDGKTVNTYTSPAGNIIKYAATKGAASDPSKITLVKGEAGYNTAIKGIMEGLGISEEEAITKLKGTIAKSLSGEKLTKEETPEAEVPEILTGDEVITIDEEGNISDILKQKRNQSGRAARRAKLLERIAKFETEKWADIEKWLSANFPNVPVHRVKNIIRETNGSAESWGMLKNGAIYVYENAEVGTIYHEVFEAVWKMFSDEKEQKAVRAEFRQRKGTFIDRPTGRTVAYKDATDEEVKEQLAEEFRDYVLHNKNVAKPTQGKGFVSKLFADIVNFIREFFTGEKAQVATANLFDKIGTGYYKQYSPYDASLSYAKKGIIDIEQAFSDDASEHRIKNLTSSQVHDVMQHLTYLTLKDILDDNKSLFELPTINKKELYSRLKAQFNLMFEEERTFIKEALDEKEISKEQADSNIKTIDSLASTLDNEWNDIVEKHQEYLGSYNIEFDEEDELVAKDENNSGRGDYQDAHKIDVFKKANGAVKLLLATIPVVDDKGNAEYSSIGGVRLEPVGKIFISLMNNLHTSRNVEEMISRIKAMADDDSTYKSLYSRIMRNITSLDGITQFHDGQLVSSLWRTFKKQNPEVKNVFIFENGEVEVGDSNLATAAREQAKEYSSGISRIIKGGKSKLFKYSIEKKSYVGVPEEVKKINISNNTGRIAFLKQLGINFTIDQVNKLRPTLMESFKKATQGIYDSINEARPFISGGGKALDISGRLLQLATVRAAIANPEFDSTFFNVDGERVQTFIGTNAGSDLFHALSQIDNIRELENTPYAYLITDAFVAPYTTKHDKLIPVSVILSKMFDPVTGDRIAKSADLMKTGWADGTINKESGKKKQTSKLTYRERLVQELNLNARGYYYSLVPGDASLQWMHNMGNHISNTTLDAGYEPIFEIFKGYFIAELLLSREERPIAKSKDRNTKDLRFFKHILGDSLHDKIIKEKGEPEEVYAKNKAKIDSAVEAFINNEASNLEKLLSDYQIIQVSETGNYDIINVVESDFGFRKTFDVTKDTLKNDLRTITVNYIINNIEQHKLLYSDPYQYSDELKRIKSFNSPRQAIIHSSSLMNIAFDNIYNVGYYKGDIGHTDMTRDHFRTVTLSDVTGVIDLPGYSDFKETDGSGAISYKAYRNFRIRAGEWNASEEKQYRYDIAYEKEQKKLDLTSEERKILRDGNPSIKSAYTPLKPIVSGNKGNNRSYNDIVLDKFALYPLSYRILHKLDKNSNAVKMYNKMQKEDIDYIVYESGRKVGAEKQHAVYNEDGSFNNAEFEGVVNVPFNIISIQSEVPSKDEPLVTRGSQITKLATLDMMDAGVPVDFMNDKPFNERFLAWSKLSETQKMETSELYREIKKNQYILEAVITTGVNRLMRKLGIKKTKDGDFEIADPKKAAKILKEEIFKREVNDNISDALAAFEGGNIVIEATPAYHQIRNILYSLADKNFIKPKINGGQKVQIPSTLLEANRIAIAEINGKKGYVSDVLKFYEDKDGKRVCEVMLGRWFDSSMSDEELLNYLNNTEEGKKILSGIGFRIPTQRQNSIDAFVVKKFLPKEFGDSVVIPAALVQKAGSDFDIDKLSVYLKNVRIDKSGKPHLVELASEDTSLEKRYEKYIQANTEDEDELSLQYLPTLEEFSKLNIWEQSGRKALENAYIESLENLVTSKYNFSNLIDPNSADQLKGLSKQISTKLGFGSFDYTSTGNIISRGFMSRLRHAFVTGKYAIGIAAVNNTNHAQNQHTLIYVDPDRFEDIDKKDLWWLTAGTMNKEDIGLKFKKYNSLNIGGKKVPVLSMVKNALRTKTYPDGQNISNIISQFIDGYVDISKGPWIMELGATPNVASTFLFLVKAGVPIEDVSYFMNQPIIRDYLKAIENEGYSWLFIDSIYKDTLETDKYFVPEESTKNVKEIPSAHELFKMIGAKSLTKDQKAQQAFILKEFVKYAQMATHLFHVIQGSNFDTANFNDPYLIFKKHQQYLKAQKTIISSVDDLINNSFVSQLQGALHDVRDAYANILVSDKPNVRDVIEKTLLPFVDESDRDFVKIARNAVNSLFDWAVQTDGNFTKFLTKALIEGGENDTFAEEIYDFKREVMSKPSHPLYNNLVIKSLSLNHSDRLTNIRIKNKENKVYDQNQMIQAFKEIRDYVQPTSNLYKKLVTVAVVQSGLTNSPISFTSLLPFEDFKTVYNDILSKLEEKANLEDYITLNVFERTNWNNFDIVPSRAAKFKTKDDGTITYNDNMELKGFKEAKQAVDEGRLPQLLKLSDKAKEANNDIITYTWEKLDELLSPEELKMSFGKRKARAKAIKNEMRKKGDYSYINKGLFKKVYQGNEPLTTHYSFTNKEGELVEITEYVYKAINAWGDSFGRDNMYFSANEFYTTETKSALNNGYIKVDEVADSAIVPYFIRKTKAVKQKSKDDKSNSELPKC